MVGSTPPILPHKGGPVNASFIRQLIIFVLILAALNFFFGRDGLHISIIGSVVLTIVLWFVFSLFKSK